LRAKRSERRANEDELRETGRPVRQHQISWPAVGVIWYLASGCGVPMLFMALAVPLIALRVADPNNLGDPALLAAVAVTISVWLGLSALVTIRRFRRQRQTNREYWREYRRAMARAQALEDEQSAE
jgi:hypothetical protein